MLNMSYDDYMDLNDYDFSDTRVETAIFLYVYPVFLVVGVSGNVLSVVLLRHFSHTTSSTVVYLIAVSVIDLLILLIRCGNDWLRVMVDYDLSQRLMVHSDVICKVYPFVFNFALHASKWLVVAAAVEGAVSTARPARVAIMCTLTRARSTMLLMSVLLVCVNMHYFWSYELVEIKDYGVCVVTCTFTRYGHYVSEMFVENVFPVINLLLNDILPEMIVAGCAGVMAVNVARGRHRGDDKLRAWQARYLLDPESHDRLKVTFLVVSLCYVVLMLPTFAFSLFQQFVEKPGYIEYTYRYDMQKNVALIVCVLAENVFLSFKFFLYLVMLPKFRTHFVRLFAWCCCRANRSHVLP